MSDAPGILIVSAEAERYRDLLIEAGIPSGDVSIAADSSSAARQWSGQQVCLGEPHLLAPLFPGCDEIRWIQSTWAGLTPLIPAARAGVTVTGVKEVFGPQMFEYVLGYLLAWELDLEKRSEHQRAGQWDNRDTGRLGGKTIGIMGTGSIGRYMARQFQALGLEVMGYSRSGRQVDGFDTVFAAEELSAFLSGLDYLVSVLPDTPATDDLLDARAFSYLHSHCRFINVGRGNLVDEQALADVLNEGRLAGAVLDVFKQEPLPANHPFWSTPGLIITGHIAAKSYPEDIAALFMENYCRFLDGQELNYRLDPEQGY